MATTAARVAPEQFPDAAIDIEPGPAGETQTAILAGGCFWCVEGVYRQLAGVLDVVSGYCGGSQETANYRDVCSGRTTHAEAVEIRFDPRQITFGQILKVFFSVAHDPTQLNRQGADVGTQHRSAIFCTSDRQAHVAKAYIAQLNEARVFAGPIVTRVAEAHPFYKAEDYHQDYAALNPDQSYVACTALPKVEKVRKSFPQLVRIRGH